MCAGYGQQEYKPWPMSLGNSLAGLLSTWPGFLCLGELGPETACIYWLGTIDTDRSTLKDLTGFKHEKSDISSENCLGIAPGLKYFSKFICVRVPCYIFQNRGNLITSSLGKENPTNPVYICSHVSERFSLTAISYKWCNPLPGRVQEYREALYW